MERAEIEEEPLIFRKVLNWALLNWSLDDWKTVLSDEKMLFRSGVLQKTAEPQWERTTESFDENFEFFLKHSQQGGHPKWLYFDYKYMKDCSHNLDKLRNEINWKSLGLADVGADDSTIWIGSKGAHTPCHMDTYGYNVVCQLYGRKLWLLFPPNENLQPTRIPYEESSIYSKLNFFSPDCNDFRYFREITTCKKIILEPGDVLRVPNKWWHYVENLETSISLNVWIPKPQDDEERLKESIVQFLVKQLSDIEESKQILNPNMEDVILSNSSRSILDIVKQTFTVCQNRTSKSTHKRQRTESIHVNSGENLLLSKEDGTPYEFELIPTLPKQEFYLFMHQQNDKFAGSNIDGENTSTLSASTSINSKLLNALTHPEVIELIKDKLLNE
ncbi:unnamed protein product [Phaedon cochleariae]|uniref:JmjC domain-containing protein n=1 Tax=Phaedon cochleariae TaxID=80249 RepID=A0A9P0DU63_PHACE|nr:unnamed protein product [Phaedon cochleariae]